MDLPPVRPHTTVRAPESHVPGAHGEPPAAQTGTTRGATADRGDRHCHAGQTCPSFVRRHERQAHWRLHLQ
jgi:hypothetical protein